MNDLTKSEFLSFLYSEKERVNSNFSRPGWSNWAIGGSLVGLIVFLFDFMTTLDDVINWEIVLMLFITLLSFTFIAIMAYQMIFPKEEIYYPNRITTLWNEYPILESTISGLSFLVIFILLLTMHNYSWLLYIVGFLSFDKLLPLCFLFYKRNKLVPAGIKYNIIPNKGATGYLLKIISFIVFICIIIYSSWDIMNDIKIYTKEIKVATVLIGFWILIYIFFKINSTPNKIANNIDNIIEKVVYSGFSQKDAMEELMFLKYGGRVNQVVDNDLSSYFTALKSLNDVNSNLDIIIKSIDEGKLNQQNYIEWSRYINSQRSKLNDANSKGANLITKIEKIFYLPNNAKHSTDFRTLLDLTKEGQGKISDIIRKFHMTQESLTAYENRYKCRKLGGTCENLQCKKRDDKMSFIYACKVYNIKYALKLFLHHKL